MSVKNIIEFNDVVFGYTSKMININHVSFSIKEGEYVCVIGHNGSGKSTISKLLSGLIFPNSGKISVLDFEINNNNLNNLHNNIGIIFQNPDNQFVGLTVEDDIAFGLENHMIPERLMQKTINVVCESVGMEEFKTTPPSELSGGQKQRVAIASAIAINPKILIFDESTAMLDPYAKEKLKELMYTLKEKYKKTIISVTHDMEEVNKADKVIIMSKGEIIKIGSAKEIFSDREFLLNAHLDVPYITNLCLSLNENNVNIPLCENIEQLIDELWKTKK
ncbi:MAG: energy-coupling factor transporter ATPase [Mycoplasmataceae bacterium]|jgi:energy-coupling factor transport system ATP-binding protein|nr:energy-coupling factor transporter ATPase [Mycoplasmataceae bacterium]